MIENKLRNPRFSNREEEEAIEYVKNLKGFHMSWMTYLVVIPGLYILNILVSPGYMWVIWPALGWGLAIIFHGLTIFGLFGIFGAEWEQRQFEKRMRNRRR